MDVKRLLLVGLVLLSIPGTIVGVRLVRAHGRIQSARAEAAELPGTAAALQPAVDVEFDLRHPPFGVFGHPPPLPLDELLRELSRTRHWPPPGLDGAFVRMAEERRFLARRASMTERRLLSGDDRLRLQQALAAALPARRWRKRSASNGSS